MQNIFKRKFRKTRTGKNWVCIQHVCDGKKHFTRVLVGSWNTDHLPHCTSTRVYDDKSCDHSCGCKKINSRKTSTLSLIRFVQKALSYLQQSAA
ncbi:hypothetical protein KKG46_03265 [Patescibacteria group bacterium]|nr:hypothetical protein [Patescibacteria group bacterium]